MTLSFVCMAPSFHWKMRYVNLSVTGTGSKKDDLYHIMLTLRRLWVEEKKSNGLHFGSLRIISQMGGNHCLVLAAARSKTRKWFPGRTGSPSPRGTRP